jgi:hypothetical protein
MPKRKKSTDSNTGSSSSDAQNRYGAIIEKVFFDHYDEGVTEFGFLREELREACSELLIAVPDNLGDIVYSFRSRSELPEKIRATAPHEKTWIIEGAGKGKYKFRVDGINRIVPSTNAYQIKIPDATPELINMYAKSDEQALLAKVRYNRLIDTFLRVTAYSLQNHLRTSVKEIGQIEIDEIYVGVRNTGQQFVIPVQAKGGKDQIAATQIRQDLAYCQQSYPGLTPRVVAVQFVGTDVIVMFELALQGEDLKVVEEKHYRLVGSSDITKEDLAAMASISD